MLYRCGQAVPAPEAQPRNGDHGVDLSPGNEREWQNVRWSADRRPRTLLHPLAYVIFSRSAGDREADPAKAVGAAVSSDSTEVGRASLRSPALSHIELLNWPKPSHRERKPSVPCQTRVGTTEETGPHPTVS